MTITPTPYAIPVRIKSILEERQGQEYNITALAIFKSFKYAVCHYQFNAKGEAYTIDLSAWCEPYRANVEHCINYLVASKNEEFEDSYDHLYPNILNIMYVYSMRRKLALLVA